MDGMLSAIPPIASACTAAAPEAAIAATPLQVLRFLADAAERGERNALVTITGLSGSSSRPVGTLMGVTEDCSFAGSFSGGCIEDDLIAAYHAALVGHGVDDHPLEQCRDDYRFALLQAPLIIILGAAYGSVTEQGDEMFLTMAERACAAIRDHGTIELVRAEVAGESVPG